MTTHHECICFDLDDTLYEYRRYVRAGLDAAADHVAARTGRAYREELHDRYVDEEPTEGAFDRFLERHDLPADAAADLVEAFHGADDPLEPYAETEAVLSTLSDDYRLGLIADGPGGRAELRRLGVEEYFDAALVTPDVGRSKADAVVFEHVLSELSAAPTAAVYVGDDPRVDFRAPNELGMTTVRLRRGRYADLEPETQTHAPDHEIDRLDELLRLVGAGSAAEGPAPRQHSSGGTDGR